MSMVEFHDVQKFYGKFHALHNINLQIDKGETVVLIDLPVLVKVRLLEQ